MSKRRQVDVERLLKLIEDRLQYDEIAGYFTRKGKRAGYIDKDGYSVIGLGGAYYYEHLLVYLLKKGYWPSQIILIDHFDRNKSNNKWYNLREASHSQNTVNSKLRSDNKSGRRGVCFDRGENKFKAQISHLGKIKTLGYFKTIEEAAKVADAHRKSIFGEFAS